MDEAKRQPHKVQAIKKVRVNNKAGVTEEVYYPLFYEGVTREFEKYAEEELKETPTNVVKGMQVLKKYMQDKNITDVEEHTLTCILRNSKFDKRKSVSKLEKYLEARRWHLQKLAELDMRKVDRILRDTCFTFLPYRDRLGRATFFTQPTANLDFYSVEDAGVCFMALSFYLERFPMSSIFGFMSIGDCKTPSMPLLYRIMVSYKKLIPIMLFMPFSLKKIYAINENVVIRWFYNIIRPVVPAKIVKRFTMLGENLESLQEFYHPDLLPEQCGGNMGPANTDYFKEELIKFMKQLKDEYHRKNTAKK